MPSISIVRKEAERPQKITGWQDSHIYPSPDGRYDAVFFDPFEFHMTAYAWKLKILIRDSGKTENYPKLKSFLSEKGLNHLWHYSPWSGPQLFLSNWSSKSCLFNASKNDLKEVQIDGFPISSVGSPRSAGFVIVTTETSLLLDINGKLISLIDIKTTEYENPVFQWHKTSDFFFSIHRPDKNTPPLITFYDGVSGQKISSFIIDPAEIIPYRTNTYKKISRDHYSLALSKDRWSVGYFLDTWSHVEYMPGSDTLFLRVYRPKGPIYKQNGIDTCDVEEKWVEVMINP